MVVDGAGRCAARAGDPQTPRRSEGAGQAAPIRSGWGSEWAGLGVQTAGHEAMTTGMRRKARGSLRTTQRPTGAEGQERGGRGQCSKVSWRVSDSWGPGAGSRGECSQVTARESARWSPETV